MRLTGISTPLKRTVRMPDAGRSSLIPVIGAYSYTLYLNHGILVKVFQILGKKTVIPFAVPVYLGLLIVYSIITKKIVTTVTSAVLRKKA